MSEQLSSEQLLALSGVDTSTELTHLQRDLLRERAQVRTLQHALQNLYSAVVANRDIDSALKAASTLLPEPPQPPTQWRVAINYQAQKGSVQQTYLLVEAASDSEAIAHALEDYLRMFPRRKQAWASEAVRL